MDVISNLIIFHAKVERFFFNEFIFNNNDEQLIFSWIILSKFLTFKCFMWFCLWDFQEFMTTFHWNINKFKIEKEISKMFPNFHRVRNNFLIPSCTNILSIKLIFKFKYSHYNPPKYWKKIIKISKTNRTLLSLSLCANIKWRLTLRHWGKFHLRSLQQECKQWEERGWLRWNQREHVRIPKIGIQPNFLSHRSKRSLISPRYTVACVELSRPTCQRACVDSSLA